MNRKNKTHRNLLVIYGDPSGSVIVIVALLLVALLGFAALVVDLGHLFVVRAELQNAADTAALAGANNFYPHTPPLIPGRDDGAAKTAATNAVRLNKSDGIELTDSDASVRTLSVFLGPTVTGLPAVEVTVRRAVPNWFAPVLGKPTTDVSATARAVCAPPAGVNSGMAFPMPIVADNGGIVPTGTFMMGSAPGAISGWTTFTDNTATVLTITNLIGTLNPVPLRVNGINGITGTNIWLQPWQGPPSLEDPDLFSAATKYKFQTVLMPVVKLAGSWPSVSTSAPIDGFAAVYIEDVVPGSLGNNPNPGYIQAHLVRPYYTSGGGPIGGPAGDYGAYFPPRLVK